MRARATLDMGPRFFVYEGDGGDLERAERGLTDYILLLLASRVMHSCHSFLATTPNVQ